MHEKEDYFIPALAPYVEWVKAYRELISELYKEHKTVGKAWKAFRDAIPGVEQRLPFGVFEQILLFSLFLSEWNESMGADGLAEKAEQDKSDSAAYERKDRGIELDSVIQNLQLTIAETDRALADFNLRHEQNALIQREQETYLDRRVRSLSETLDMLINETQQQDEQLGQVIQEIVDDIRNRRFVLTRKQEGKEEFVQAVIQWSRQDGIQEVIQDTESKAPLKKIGRWNALRSRDGYYRLYRKIGGRVHSIYIGKHLDVDKAESRIAERERKLLRSDSATEPIEPTDVRGQMKMVANPRVISVHGDDN